MALSTKLPAPIIEGTLPAFYYSTDEACARISIPFYMSHAVNSNEIRGFHLKIKNIQGSDYIDTLQSTKVDFINSIVTFEINKEKIDKSYYIGSFYKMQLAYVNQFNVVGHYSTVGISKYTTKPKVSILNLTSTASNSHQFEYTGVYSQENQDFTEKEYSYRFVLKDQNGLIVEDTGYLIHNNSTNVNAYESSDSFLTSYDLELEQKYTIQYMVTTNNGLEVVSPIYKLMMNKSLKPSLEANFIAKLNYENGYIQLNLEGKKDNLGLEEPVKGLFMLVRSSEKTNYSQWDELERFALAYEKPSNKSWKDFTIEQGVKYQYAIQQYNREKLYSDRIYSNKVYVDFEDSFLFDGERQLKIRFNPKMSTFKKDLLESKIDTIGSKYPFIFRNAKVEYKEFPLSGLISYLMDEEGLFINNNSLFSIRERKITRSYVPAQFSVSYGPKEYYYNYLSYYIRLHDSYIKWTEFLRSKDILVLHNQDYFYENGRWLWPPQVEEIFNANKMSLFVVDTPVQEQNRFNPEEKQKTTNETSENIQLERQFKLAVLDWLTNGKPKLFKSATEGNYLVRLMNTSLSPNDQTGRMLHTFNSTAYEIDDTSYNSLVKHNIIAIDEDNLNSSSQYLKIISIPLATTDLNYVGLNSHINYTSEDGKIYFANKEILKAGQNAEWVTISDVTPGTIIKINGIEVMIGATGSYEAHALVNSIYIPSTVKSAGIVTIAYYGLLNDGFSNIQGVNVREVIGKQVIGSNNNVFATLEDIVKKVSTIYNIRFCKRPEIPVFIKSLSYYVQAAISNKEEFEALKSKLFIKNEAYNFYNALQSISEYNDKEIYYIQLEDQNVVFDAANNQIGYLIDGKIDFNLDYYLDDISVFKYQVEKPFGITEPYYKEIRFVDSTDGQDLLLGNAKRYPSNRTVTNPYLMDIRDWVAYLEAQQLYVLNDSKIELCDIKSIFNPGLKYYIKLEPTVFYDPYNNKSYMNADAYSDYMHILSLSEDADINSFKSLYDIYSHNIYIANMHETGTRTLTVKEVPIMNAGAVELQSLDISNGVYCELFYQEQLLEYDIKDYYYLLDLKRQLENDRYKLSREYMIQRCIDENQETQYLQEIRNVYQNYETKYNNYINELNRYLSTLEREG